VIVYFSQVYPFHHLHHFHDEGVSEFEISSHPIEVDVEHSSDHHHDGDIPHTNDHQHTYDKHIDWHIIRIQNSRTLTSDDQYLFSSSSLTQLNNRKLICFDQKELPYIDGSNVYSSIIRGPPPLG
jgi:hypothetical protein